MSPAAFAFGVVLLALGVTAPAIAAIPSVRLVPALPHIQFERPLCLAAPDDGTGRLFVVEQGGKIHVVANDTAAVRSQIFLDLGARVRTTHNEEGLLAMALHPQFARNGQFFVYYSASNPRRTVLSRFTVSAADSNRADPKSEIVILEVAQPYGNHNGGMILFGPEGYLYLSLGDGGSAGDPHGNGQNLSTLLGKIIRIDINHRDGALAYAIPADNPFVGRAGARPEIWAYGLRNVWRMSFDRANGMLWAGDVGQNKWEEIDIIERGGNYGWNLREGFHPYGRAASAEMLLDPVYEYGRDDGASVTGGYVYRGRRFPELAGIYLFADYVTGTIWGLRFDEEGVSEHAVMLKQPSNISSFGETADGELLVTSFDGRIYRLQIDH